jgi:hypothetical protein
MVKQMVNHGPNQWEILFLGDLFGPLFTIIHHLMLVESHGNKKKGNGIYLDCSHDRDATMG